MHITALPSDVLILIMHNLAVGQLASLSATCHFLNALVTVTVYSQFLYLTSWI
jgi:hypothetical protein